jgi:hypothetical protein
MHDNRDLPCFFIRLALIGSPPEVFWQAVPDLQEELDQRDYLLNPRVLWEPEGDRVVVEVNNVGSDLQVTADNMAEELFEIAGGVLGDVECFRVEILSISTIEHADGTH